jgi:hypothetical protein
MEIEELIDEFKAISTLACWHQGRTLTKNFG